MVTHVVKYAFIIVLKGWIADPVELVVIDLDITAEETLANKWLPNGEAIVIGLAQECCLVKIDRAFQDAYPRYIVFCLYVVIHLVLPSVRNVVRLL